MGEKLREKRFSQFCRNELISIAASVYKFRFFENSFRHILWFRLEKNALSSFADQRNAENYVFRKYDVKKVVKIKISPHRLTETGNA